jgi:hypothetical protein
MGSLQGQTYVDANGWYSTDCVGESCSVYFAKQGGTTHRIGAVQNVFYSLADVMAGNVTTNIVGLSTGQWSDYYRCTFFSNFVVDGKTYAGNTYIHKDFATGGNGGKAFYEIFDIASPGRYLIIEIPVVGLGAIRAGSLNMDYVCSLTVIVPNELSIQILESTNGQGTGGTTPAACAKCGVVGCDGSCHVEPPTVDNDLSGVIELLQFMIAQNRVKILSLHYLNGRLDNLFIVGCLLLGSILFIHFGRFVRW